MKCALWLRVSDPDTQTVENQLAPLQNEAARRGLEVVRRYEVGESAWKGRHHNVLFEMQNDARKGVFDTLIVWSLDRLSREGPAATLRIVEQLNSVPVQVISLQESWLEVSGELRELMISIVSWVARWESQRRSERTKAGLDRARANGKTLGRPKGSKDKGKRKKSGYYARYAK